MDDGSRLTLFSMMEFDLREYRDVVAVRAQNWQADAGQHLRAIVGQAVAIGDPELSAGAQELERVALSNEEFSPVWWDEAICRDGEGGMEVR